MRIFGGMCRGPKHNASWVRLKEGELEGVVVGRGPVGRGDWDEGAAHAWISTRECLRRMIKAYQICAWRPPTPPPPMSRAGEKKYADWKKNRELVDHANLAINISQWPEMGGE